MLKKGENKSMKRILITGGTVFVSKFTAEFFVGQGYDVYVLNRGSRPQVRGVTLIEADRHDIGDKLSELEFDAIIDVTAYNGEDIKDLTDALGKFGTYIMISSSAVYPETGVQPFTEESRLGENRFWGKYGTDKIEAERTLLEKIPDAYILRPPYLYGPMNNVYREAFVFDCALADRKFYLPRDGEMKLQFFHVKDLCRIIEKIMETKPSEHICNVGNDRSVTVRQWVQACYECADKRPEFVSVYEDTPQRDYFSFYDYEYCLDVNKQKDLIDGLTDLKEGLKECFDWYQTNQEEVRKKPFIQYIDEHL